MTDKRPMEPKANEVQIIPATPQPPRRPEFLELDGILPPELEFTPVTTKSGRQKFVPELQRKFIQALSITGTVRVAAEAMRAKKLQLAVPRKIHPTFRQVQQSWLLYLADFVKLVRSRQG